jgi:hypothetical protein
MRRESPMDPEPFYFDIRLPMPTIQAVAPPNDEVRQLVQWAINQFEDPSQRTSPYWVHAELHDAGHDLPLEVIQGVINGL